MGEYGTMLTLSFSFFSLLFFGSAKPGVFQVEGLQHYICLVNLSHKEPLIMNISLLKVSGYEVIVSHI